MMRSILGALLALVTSSRILVACSDDVVAGPSLDAGQEEDAGEKVDAFVDSGGEVDAGPIDKAKNCAETFGTALTDAFGRIDGTLVAVVAPGHPTCAMQNGDHVVVQIQFGGEVYRAVTNVLSTKGDPNVRFLSMQHARIGDAFDPGWHVVTTLDYVNDFSLHAADTTWVAYGKDALAQKIADELEIGAPISVFSTSSGGASSHLIHRNKTGADGAIVVHPEAATPTYLLFSFADQTF